MSLLRMASWFGLSLWGLWTKAMLALKVICWGLIFQVQVLKFVVSDVGILHLSG